MLDTLGYLLRWTSPSKDTLLIRGVLKWHRWLSGSDKAEPGLNPDNCPTECMPATAELWSLCSLVAFMRAKSFDLLCSLTGLVGSEVALSSSMRGLILKANTGLMGSGWQFKTNLKQCLSEREDIMTLSVSSSNRYLWSQKLICTVDESAKFQESEPSMDLVPRVWAWNCYWFFKTLPIASANVVALALCELEAGVSLSMNYGVLIQGVWHIVGCWWMSRRLVTGLEFLNC